MFLKYSLIRGFLCSCSHANCGFRSSWRQMTIHENVFCAHRHIDCPRCGEIYEAASFDLHVELCFPPGQIVLINDQMECAIRLRGNILIHTCDLVK